MKKILLILLLFVACTKNVNKKADICIKVAKNQGIRAWTEPSYSLAKYKYIITIKWYNVNNGIENSISFNFNEAKILSKSSNKSYRALGGYLLKTYHRRMTNQGTL